MYDGGQIRPEIVAIVSRLIRMDSFLEWVALDLLNPACLFLLPCSSRDLGDQGRVASRWEDSAMN
jgi:hypothetical protein